jgi:hypothetical protein
MTFKRPPTIPLSRNKDDINEIYNRAVTDLEQYLLEITQPAGTGFTTSNVTTTKDLDASTATLSDVANILGTLIDALKSKGLLD